LDLVKKKKKKRRKKINKKENLHQIVL